MLTSIMKISGYASPHMCLQLHDHMLSDVCVQFNSYISALCLCYSMRLKRRVKWNGKTMMA